MLKKFYVWNYRNLQLTEPVVFSDITCFYGGCASGKSNFCKALADVVKTDRMRNMENNRASAFWYNFCFECHEIELHYTRDASGKICRAKFCCDRQKYAVKKMDSLLDMKDLLENIVENVPKELTMLEWTLRRLHRFLKETFVFVDEAFRDLDTSDSSQEWKRYSAKKCGRTPPEWERMRLAICDDIESREDICDFVNQYPVQAVVTSVRPRVLLELCRDFNSFYGLRQGRVVNIKEASPKDLRTENQLAAWLKDF